MKLIIDIPDEVYNTFHKGNWSANYEGKKIRDIVMNGTPLAEWLSSFNTDSAPQCFNAVQELKKKVGFNK